VGDTYESLEGTMIACFYDKIDPELRPPEDHRIWPRINDLDAADIKCDELGGIDTVWAGIGSTGLVAFNEAPRSFCQHITVEEYAASKTRIGVLNDDTMVALAERSFGGCLDRVPPMYLTIGFHIICSAKRAVYMVATGDWKKTVCRILLLSEPTVEYPVTILPKYIPDVTLMTNEYTIDHPLSHEIRGW
jgi:glucosamine-6-phosphate deaminase